MLISFGEIKEDREGWPCRAFRWTFQAGRDRLGFIHQHHLGGEWRDSHTLVYSIFLMEEWSWGMDHFWWDGPHCILGLGRIRIQWFRDGCRKCNGEE